MGMDKEFPATIACDLSHVNGKGFMYLHQVLTNSVVHQFREGTFRIISKLAGEDDTVTVSHCHVEDGVECDPVEAWPRFDGDVVIFHKKLFMITICFSRRTSKHYFIIR